ncbi:hypothetical protein [Mangrovimonas futianensis]|uniref:hypothetical protein n=1 Tax=Mangrovimonas futianensis TaxID=2895523 RepID=UPI001E2F1872|nr:hypothetical protein [Mangrovimonas futianensis]MCF1422576.1 hypothetical protein [Mangrovimonas futianensis]
MKTLPTLIAYFSFVLISFAQTDLILSIDGEEFEVNLNETYHLKINGKDSEVLLKEKDTLLFKDSKFKFKHIKNHKITQSKIEEGVIQIMMFTAMGSGVLVQKYESFDPNMLKEMMLNEVIKESVSYGYKMKREDYEKELSDGVKLKVLKAVLEYKGEIETYEVTSFSGKRDEGLLFVTMNLDSMGEEEGADMIGLMWDTLILVP